MLKGIQKTMGMVENCLEKRQQNNIFQGCKSLHFPKLTLVQRLKKKVCSSNNVKIKVIHSPFSLWNACRASAYLRLTKILINSKANTKKFNK